MSTLTQKNHQTTYAKRGLNPDRLQAIRDFAGSSILDVGCGSGAYILRLAQDYDIRGVDYQRYDTWDAMPDRFAVSEASELTMEENSVDTVLSFEALEHLENPAKALKEYYRVCRKNVILSVPNCDVTAGMKQSGMTYYHWTDPTHINFFNRESIGQLVESCGFKIVKNGYINHLSLFPLILESFGLSGWKSRALVKLLSRIKRHHYYLTCLVVAEK